MYLTGSTGKRQQLAALWLAICVAALSALPALATLPDSAEDYVALRAWPAGVDSARLKDALLDAGQNWTELAAALDAVAGRYPAAEAEPATECLAWLLIHAPHLDRLELTSEILHNNLAYALEAADSHGYDPASDFFRRYVLNYRIDDEPVTDWRGAFSGGSGPGFARVRAGFETGLLTAQARQAMDGFAFRERGYFGPQADPLSIRNAMAGTKSEAALLLAADLRGSGWATRFVRDNASGESWVEVYYGDGRDYDPARWLPAYPQAPERSGDPAAALELCGGSLSVVTAGDAFGREQVTACYSPVGTVSLSFTRGGQPVDKFEGFAITTWRAGRYVPLDDLDYPVSAMDYPLDSSVENEPQARRFHLAAPGEYRLEAGVRYPGGVVDVKLLPFSLQPGDLTTLELALDAAPGLPLTAFVERQLGPLPEDPAFDPAGRYLFAVYDSSEPSVRTRELLVRFADVPGLSYVILDETMQHQRAKEFLEWMQVKADDPRPVVVLVAGGETRLYYRGYELSIADWVQRALEEAE